MANVDTNFKDELLLISRAFFEATARELDRYTTQKNEIVVEGETMTLLTPSHIHFAKYGRAPGKKPPLDAMLSFVKSKGIKFDGLSERGTAFAIQAIIGKNGTKNYVVGAPNALEEALDNNLEEYSRRTGFIIAAKVSDEVNKVYKDIYPKQKEFKI